uniref:hypothetical protein n=1 Tax=Xanthomonas floridensis TaxID=1843580 RepID=UPI00137A5DCC|nr:hypothetical protein [Xanthomonas floridensis]
MTRLTDKGRDAFIPNGAQRLTEGRSIRCDRSSQTVALLMHQKFQASNRDRDQDGSADEWCLRFP